jgi:hypothetical protein
MCLKRYFLFYSLIHHCQNTCFGRYRLRRAKNLDLLQLHRQFPYVDSTISRWPKSQPKYRLIKPEVDYKRRNVKSDKHTHTHIPTYAINPPSPLCDANTAKMFMQNKQPKKDPTQHGMQITQYSSQL